MFSLNQLTEADKNILVDPQDSSFTITIEVPGMESFELQVWLLNLSRHSCFIFRHQTLWDIMPFTSTYSNPNIKLVCTQLGPYTRPLLLLLGTAFASLIQSKSASF